MGEKTHTNEIISFLAATCCSSIEFVIVFEIVVTLQASEQVYYQKTTRPDQPYKHVYVLQHVAHSSSV